MQAVSPGIDPTAFMRIRFCECCNSDSTENGEAFYDICADCLKILQARSSVFSYPRGQMKPRELGRSIMCRLLGHSTYWEIREQSNMKVIKRDEICQRCGALVGTLTWPNLNWRQE